MDRTRRLLCVLVTCLAISILGTYINLNQHYAEDNRRINNNISLLTIRKVGDNSTNSLPNNTLGKSTLIDDAKCPLNRSQLSREGTWIGPKHWTPPEGWSIFSPTDMRKMYAHKKILWMGDSQSRRAMLTMYKVFNATDNKLDAVNIEAFTNYKYQSVGEVPCNIFGLAQEPNDNFRVRCRRIPYESGGILSISAPPYNTVCLDHIYRFFKHSLSGKTTAANNADIIVVAMGAWELESPHICARSSPLPMKEKVDRVIQVLHKFQRKTGKKIIWRTSSFIAGNSSSGASVVARLMNARAIEQIHKIQRNDTTCRTSGLSYVDWATAVEPRSFGTDRIKGDIPPHMGFEARMVLLQQLTNHLCDLGIIERVDSSG